MLSRFIMRREQLVLLFVGCAIIAGSGVMYFINASESVVPFPEEPKRPAPETESLIADDPLEPLPVIVSVQGSVQFPGVYRFDKTGRVAHALESAGGEDPGADTTQINLAAQLVDGTTLYVPRHKESNIAASLAKNHGSYLLGGAVSTSSIIDSNATSPLININTATQAQLETLPGIGEAYARAIIAHRTKQPFRKVEDIVNVRGIAEKRFEGMRDQISVQ
ncbi:MAG TPA: ComEA family DNA-binding protein [Candidatus Hydrogenedentes bacterium]|nr:ComEA family DNA-binding protein [Candidatus Hydrogenedentota bacterium]